MNLLKLAYRLENIIAKIDDRIDSLINDLVVLSERLFDNVDSLLGIIELNRSVSQLKKEEFNVNAAVNSVENTAMRLIESAKILNTYRTASFSREETHKELDAIHEIAFKLKRVCAGIKQNKDLSRLNFVISSAEMILKLIKKINFSEAFVPPETVPFALPLR